MPTGHPHPGAGRDTGSATIWVLTASSALVAFAAVVIALASVQWARQRAEAAADLAALAGAAAVSRGGDGCAEARRVADANGGRLLSCDLTGAVVSVRAAAPLPPALQRWGATRVVASARAGPG